jgi:predicted ATPase
MRRVRSLELLAPNLMRKRARTTDSDIGSGGEKLTAFLHGIKGAQRSVLVDLLKTFYPQLIDFKVSSPRAGWKKLNVIEQFGSQRLETEARHINDGLLRVLAILAQTDSNRSLILLDEIENGMNPEIIEKLVDVLVKASQQILVTSHSPMILNYLDDEIARQAINFIYKNQKGETRARPFFSIPRIDEKLNVMGPGEAFVDTDLNLLTQECVALDDKELAEEAARATENR